MKVPSFDDIAYIVSVGRLPTTVLFPHLFHGELAKIPKTFATFGTIHKLCPLLAGEGVMDVVSDVVF